MKFAKMHGLGNCYVYVNQWQELIPEERLELLARVVSDVHTGVGSDGLILIGPSECADFRMRIFNADGSEAKNCGNGLRCVAKYVYERRMIDRREFTIETLGGTVSVEVDADFGRKVRQVTVDMGAPRLTKAEVPMLGDPASTTIDEEVAIVSETYRLTALSMGNPHAILFVPDVNEVPIHEIGPSIEFAPIFPERVNVGFVQVRGPREIDYRVWERGSGITQACGTGACAAVAAGILNGLLERNTPITVHLLGGDLEIVWSENSHIYMKGPAEFILDGEFFPADSVKSLWV